MTRPDFSASDYMDEPARYPQLEVIDLAGVGAGITDDYHNLVVNAVNGHCLRLAAFDGDYPWHVHPTSDELFLVVEGCLLVDLADGRTLRLEPWQAATVPAGVVHRTRTEGRTVNLCFEQMAADTEFVDAPPDGGGPRGHGPPSADPA